MRRALLALVVVAILAVAQQVVERHRTFVDLTAEKTLSLTDETERVVDRVRERTRVTAFLGREEPGRVEAAILLRRYRRLNPRITVRVLDPADAPGEARRLGVGDTGLLGPVVVTSADRVEHAASSSEADVTAALARLQRRHAAGVCFTAGHGEADPASTEPDGLTSLVTLLRRNGYEVGQADLLADPQVPAGCDVLAFVNVRTPLGDAEAPAAAWLAAGGRALVLTDPESPVDLGPLLARYRLGVDRGIVVEGDRKSRLPDDPTTPIVRRYSSASPVVRGLAPTYFPGVQQVAVGDDADVPGLTVALLADTSPASFLEREPLTPSFGSGDERGPITVGAAADQSEVSEGRVRRTRLVVWGDADFATNAFLPEAANATLLVQALDWLTLAEDLVSVAAHLPEDRPLRFTDARARYALFLSAGVVPAGFVLAGALVWAVRRGR